MLFHSVLLLCVLVSQVASWSHWEYNVQWYYKAVTAAGREEEVINKKNQFYAIWSNTTIEGALYDAPRPRRGHTMVLARTPNIAPFNGGTYILMFGGRDNQNFTDHVPKTYNIQKINGTIEFSTYEDKPVNPCADTEGLFYTEEQRANCDVDTTSKITIGKIYNDVWAYRICNETAGERVFGQPCINSGWMLLDAGGFEGGCTIELGILVCTVPSERYQHGAVMYNDQTMYVYGGFSQRCVDFCDDVWFYDLYMGGWREVYEAGALSRLYYEVRGIDFLYYSDVDVPKDPSASGWAGPGKRWRHSMVIGDEFVAADGKPSQPMAVFGGHRLWHGWSLENSQANSWENHTTYPAGGYLNDLWIYVKELDYETTAGETLKTSQGTWRMLHANESCRPTPGLTWDTRNLITCEVNWPQERAGHSSVYDTKRGRIWIFGGYNTYFPYLSTDGLGSGIGVTAMLRDGFVPYPGFNYYMNDLWFYDLALQNWTQIIYPVGQPNDKHVLDYPIPPARADHIMLLTDDVLFLHGGFADNSYMDDTWYFNITTSRWLRKRSYVWPSYPRSCTDDWESMNITFSYGNTPSSNAASKCHQLLWPKHLERDSISPFDIVPYSSQSYYWPDTDYGPYNNPYKDVPLSYPYYGIQDKRQTNLDGSLTDRNPVVKASAQSPIFPYAATGPMQYARPFIYPFNETHNATLLESCTSVWAEPTRNMVLDGMAGRSDKPIFIPLPRRQRPGWDGCRSRADGRTDLPTELNFLKPLPRSEHDAVYFPDTNEIFMYGGMVSIEEHAPNLTYTHPSLVRDDMWYYNLYHCINNCSLHGVCDYGFCFCDVGYYGLDCSNTSCPGTFCMYDENSHEQICKHGCHAGYNHTDEDQYVQDIYKLPCSFAEDEDPGEINGICDGYGSAYCAPPYVGDDCSIKDCKANCSFNGWCSIEFPVSRCMCDPGYFGEICQYKQCLNNCSFPNGNCNFTSGQCNCNMRYSPYLNTREFKPWAGEDCSYLHPYCAASHSHIPLRSYSTAVVAVVLLLCTVVCNVLHLL